MTFGEYARDARRNVKLGMRSAARVIGISSAYLCRIELDQCASPSPDVLWRMADAYGVDPVVMMENAGKLAEAIGFEAGSLSLVDQREVFKAIREMQTKEAAA